MDVSAEKEPVRLHRQAVAAFDAGDLAGAEAGFRRLVAIVPEVEEAWHRLGVACSRRVGLKDAAHRLGELAREAASAAGARVAARMAAQGRDMALAVTQARAAGERDGWSEASSGLLCRLLRRTGQLDEAVVVARRALRQAGPGAAAMAAGMRLDMAEILLAGGDPAVAADAAAAAVAATPLDARARLLLSDALAAVGDRVREEAALRDWMAHFPSDLPPRHRLVNFLVGADRHAEAAPLLLRILRERPDDGRFYTLAAMVMSTLEKDRRARTLAQRGVELLPNSPHAHVALATVMTRAGEYVAAEAPARAAVALAPDMVEGHNLLALALQRQNRFAEATRASEEALRLAPDDPDAIANLATLQWVQEDYEGSLATFARALAIRPDDPEMRFNRALDYFALGRLDAAWADFGLRWKRRKAWRRSFRPPWWDGSRVAGRLLVWGEQGIGDEVLASGLLREAAARAGGLVVESDRRFVPVLRRSFPEITVVPRVDPPDPATRAGDIVAQSPMIDLPMLLRRRRADFRRHDGYLLPDPARAAALRAHYRARGGRLVVGLSWHSTNPKFGLRKSFELPGWAPILRVPGVTFVSLQYGDRNAEVAAAVAASGADIVVDPDIDSLADIDGFVAQVAAMDLVITISNSTAHFAGAVGRPCWLMLPRGNGLLWYWLMCEGETCPWYPSVRVFRQDRPGDWTGTIERVAEALPAAGPR